MLSLYVVGLPEPATAFNRGFMCDMLFLGSAASVSLSTHYQAPYQVSIVKLANVGELRLPGSASGYHPLTT